MFASAPMIGLGYPTPQQQGGGFSAAGVVGGAAAGVAAGITTGMLTGSIKRGSIAAAGASMLAIAPMTGPAAPFLAAAGGIVTAMATMFRGCGSSCTQSSQLADEAAAAIERIKAAYWAQPVRTRASQQAALIAFEEIAQALYAACSSPQLGPAGQRCIAERLVRGGTAPWCPSPDKRGCDWWTASYDPIANDQGVEPDSVSDQVTAALGLPSGMFGGGLGDGEFSLLALAGVAAVAVGVMML